VGRWATFGESNASQGSARPRSALHGIARQGIAGQFTAKQCMVWQSSGTLSAGNGHQHLGNRVLVGDLREVKCIAPHRGAVQCTASHGKAAHRNASHSIAAHRNAM